MEGFNIVSRVRARDKYHTDRPGCQAYTLFPQSFQDVVDLLLPEPKARGMFWGDYAVHTGTYHEKFYAKEGQKGPLDERIAAKYRWKVGVEAQDDAIPEK